MDEPGLLVAQMRCDSGGRTELCKIWFLVNRGGASRCLGWRETEGGRRGWRVVGLALLRAWGVRRGMAGRG